MGEDISVIGVVTLATVSLGGSGNRVFGPESRLGSLAGPFFKRSNIDQWILS